MTIFDDLLSRLSGDGGAHHRQAPPSTRGDKDGTQHSVGRQEIHIAPAFVYDRYPGDRHENPVLDSDRDPICRYHGCRRVLLALSRDRLCAAGHRQRGRVDDGFVLRTDRTPPVVRLASVIAPEAPEPIPAPVEFALVAEGR